jgi:Phage integrase family.
VTCYKVRVGLRAGPVDLRRTQDAAEGRAQLAAYIYLALDGGARKSELDGLLWSDLDFDTGTLTIARRNWTRRS